MPNVRRIKLYAQYGQTVTRSFVSIINSASGGARCADADRPGDDDNGLKLLQKNVRRARGLHRTGDGDVGLAGHGIARRVVVHQVVRRWNLHFPPLCHLPLFAGGAPTAELPRKIPYFTIVDSISAGAEVDEQNTLFYQVRVIVDADEIGRLWYDVYPYPLSISAIDRKSTRLNSSH